MSIGAVLVMIQTCFHLRLLYRNINDLRVNEPEDIKELRNDIALWQRTADSMSTTSKDEDLILQILLRKVHKLQAELKKKISSGSLTKETFQRTLEDLQQKVFEGSFGLVSFF